MTSTHAHVDRAHPPRVPPAEHERLARRYASNPNLEALLRDTGERTWARLAQAPGVEIWVNSWPEGAETGWHDHAGSPGALAVASGSVVEETWALGAVQRRRLAEGDSSSSDAEHVHNVCGRGKGRSLTVHAYAPRLVEMTAHTLRPAGPEPTEPTRTAGTTRTTGTTREGVDR